MVDIRTLQQFYTSPLGRQTQRNIKRHIAAHSRAQPTDLVAALGYGFPYLKTLAGKSPRRLALMPTTLGAVQGETCPQCLTHPHLLPLTDASLHSLLMVHCLEHVTNSKSVLREAWRVLQDEGDLVIVLPYRLGLWARRPGLPFGHGTPYSRLQIQQLLDNAGFATHNIQRCVHFPPTQSRPLLRFFVALEPILRWILPALAGIIIVHARKSVLHPKPITRHGFARVGKTSSILQRIRN